MGQRSRTFLWLAVLGIAFLVSLRLPVEGQVAVASAPPPHQKPSDIMAAWYTANGLADEDKEGLVVYAGHATGRLPGIKVILPQPAPEPPHRGPGRPPKVAA